MFQKPSVSRPPGDSPEKLLVMQKTMASLLANLAILAIISSATALPQGFANISAAAAPDPPHAMPQNAAPNALRYQPVLDYDTDSCYNVPAIDAQGNVCQGLDNKYTTNTKDCRDAKDLDNQNVYARARCNRGWCAYMYEHYFEKDVGLEHVGGVASGHRHEWENIVVFVKDGQVKASYIAASQHDGYETKEASQVRFQGTHAKIVYHKAGAGTHAMRFANEKDDNVENDKHVWIQGALIDWNGYPSTQIRDKMISAFAGGGIRPKIDDALFGNYLKKAIGKRIPEFDPYSDG